MIKPSKKVHLVENFLAPEAILEYFSKLELVEFSGVHGDGKYVERVGLDEFTGSRYACGMFLFRKTFSDAQ